MFSGSCLRSGSSKLPTLLLEFFALATFVAGVANPSQAQDRFQDRLEVYGGYSYFRASVPLMESPATCPTCLRIAPFRTTRHANLNGWQFSARYKLLPYLGAAAEFNGGYGAIDGADTREHTFLVGPQVSLPTRVSPFIHAMVGIVKESQSSTSCLSPAPCVVSLGTDTSFASTVGAGFDIKLARLVKLRLFQVDYLRTHLHGATQNQARATAGIVFHF